ncbi:MAG: response regulator transcription factor [Clostridiales bacterium]|nr:response regulator transcription factor [Clostridiales bacterium]
MNRIMIVEDDRQLCSLYSTVLRKAGFETIEASNGQEACDKLETEHVHMTITDIMMPVMDGYSLVEAIRDYDPSMPILMITAKDDFKSKQKGFNVGADDYMTKPVDVNEMVLRVKALFRRANILNDHMITVGSTVLDYDSMTVSDSRGAVELTQKEFQLLYKLLSYPGKIMTRLQLMDEIWGPDSKSDAQTIDVHINRLRRHFENNEDFELQTVRGLGYKAVVKQK